MIRLGWSIYGLWLLVIVPAILSAQELGTHFLRDVPQVRQTNPAFVPLANDTNLRIISLPSFQVNYGNTQFTYYDLFEPVPGTDFYYLDGDRVIGRLDERNLITASAQLDFFSIDRKKGNTYYSFRLSDRFESFFGYHKDLFNLLWNGNAAYIGRSANLSTRVSIVHYREFAVSLSHHWENWKVGVTGSYLNGLVNISTENGTASFYTSTDIDTLQLKSDYRINMAGLGRLSGSKSGYLLNGGNSGFALDVGVQYAINDHLSFAGSIVDIGFIDWQEDVRNYAKKGTFVFDGISIGNVFDQQELTLQNYLDSVYTTFGPEESTESYQHFLVPKIYTSFSYHLSDREELHFLLHGILFDGIQPALAVNYRYQLKHWLTLMVQNSYRNNTILNIGLGLQLQLRKWQVYATSDNVPALFSPKRFRNYQFRLGVNRLIGAR